MAVEAPVVRLAGTNVEAGERIPQEAGLPLPRAYDFGEAARMAVEAARIGAEALSA